jgi:hypothetical protein
MVVDYGLLTVEDVDHQVGALKVFLERQPPALGERVVCCHHADTDVVEEHFVSKD